MLLDPLMQLHPGILLLLLLWAVQIPQLRTRPALTANLGLQSQQSAAGKTETVSAGTAASHSLLQRKREKRRNNTRECSSLWLRPLQAAVQIRWRVWWPPWQQEPISSRPTLSNPDPSRLANVSRSMDRGGI